VPLQGAFLIIHLPQMRNSAFSQKVQKVAAKNFSHCLAIVNPCQHWADGVWCENVHTTLATFSHFFTPFSHRHQPSRDKAL